MENLKEPVREQLEKSGFLNKIRAQMRAQLFKVAEKHENKASIERVETANIVQSEVGQISATLIKDFMEQLNLVYSYSVFLPECHLDDDRSDIHSLQEMFQVKSEPGRPLLFSVIEYLIQRQGDSSINDSSQKLPVMGNRELNLPLYANDDFEEIMEDISRPDSEEFTTNRDSQAASSMGVDASASSLALEEFDYIEPVRKQKLHFQIRIFRDKE